MSYKVLFTGLAAFVEREPQARLVLLPDGRDTRKDHESIRATIGVRESDVQSSDWWPWTVENGKRFFPIESPSLITLSGMDENPNRLDTAFFDGKVPNLNDLAPSMNIALERAATIAQIPIRTGTLEAFRRGGAYAAELTVPHHGPVTIEAHAADGTRKSIVLNEGADIVIANVSDKGGSFSTYAMLDSTRNFDPSEDFGPSVAAARPGSSAPRRRTRGRKAAVPQVPTFTLGRTASALPSSVETFQEDVPREFYALVNSPSHVVAAVELRLTAGITKDAQSEGDEKFVIPSTVTGPYDITLSVQAIGFTFRDDVAVFKLHVTKETPYPTVDIFLTPDVVAEETPQTVAIFYSVDGQVIGSVERVITVHLEENDLTRAAADEALRRSFSAPVAQEPPDLTLMIRDDLNGKLAWSFITPHKVTVPVKPVHSAIAGNGRMFAEVLVNNANGREGTAGLYEFLLGTGADIRKLIPPLVWPILEKVRKATEKPTPSLLIISNEPYIPWELATFPDNAKLPHPDLAPFLGVQTCVGRWLIGDRLPPPRAHTVRHAYVLSGEYNLPKWGRLLKAEEEASEIHATYGAIPVEAKHEQILGIFSRQPAADLLHFSMHGKSDDDGIEDGLIPIDGGAVKPQMITGAIDEARKKKWTVAPFVFLNACQVGAGSRILGDYGGMAAAFVNGGAIGVVAPLWKVKDETAKDIALSFYKAIFNEGVSPAEAIRRARASFVKAKQPVSATYLAYQYFGHPSLQLRKES